jgi:phage tail sheath protein FI
MPEYLAPGVFIEEVEIGPRPVEGVPTSTAALLGETERGPTRPRLVTSFDGFRRHFGDIVPGAPNHLVYAVNGFFENGGQRAYICRIAGKDAETAVLSDPAGAGTLDLKAAGAGEWGNRVHVKVVDSTTKTGNPPVPVGFRLQIAYWQKPGAYPDPFVAGPPPRPKPTLVEDFDDLVWDDPKSPDFYAKRLKGNSSLVTIDDPDPQPLQGLPAAPLTPLATPGPGPADGTPPDLPEFEGNAINLDERTGLSALDLDEYREVALVAAPGITSVPILQSVITHCENNKFRFAVVDSAKALGDPSSIDPRTTLADTEYAAFYYPWIQTADLLNGAPRLVAPSGHVLGLYARTDIERGVWKAPANDVLRGVFGLEYPIDTGSQQVLNPRGVNAIRQFPGRGIRVWGSRTLSSNSLWKYVPVRRLFIFLERSIYEGTQWVVFEPNDERLWQRVKDTIRLFLRTQWRNGAMMGLTEDEAFTIACDRSTMTQDDILNGRLVCRIGIAPVRPAEFVIFQFSQNTAEAQS